MNLLGRTTLNALCVALILGTSAAAHAAETAAKTAVLVHGAFADGSSWNKVVPILQHAGMKTIAVQLPMTSLGDDAAFTRRALEQAEGPVVLVGHSWGGVVITETGISDKVQSLVYVSAFAPSTAEHLHDILAEEHGKNKIPKVPGFKPIVDSQGFMALPEENIVNYFAPDIPEADAKLIASSQGKLHKDALDQRITTAAWESKPSWFIVSSDDQMIAPDVMRGQAKKIGANTTELATSHVPMLSKPADVAKVILKAAGIN